MGEVVGQSVGGQSRTAADVDEGIKLATSAGVLLDDGVVDIGMIVTANLGVGFALLYVVVAERLLLLKGGGCRRGSGVGLGHAGLASWCFD